MSGRLQSASISAPGFLGLNSQESEVTLESGYATIATNCIIDRFGRLGSRRGWQYITTDNDTLLDTDYIKSIFEFKDTTGTITYISAGGGKLFTGSDTLTEKKVRNALNTLDIALSTSNDNWQIQSLPVGSGPSAEAEAFLGQAGNPLLVYTDIGVGQIFYQVGDVGTVPTGYSTATFDPNCVLSAFGRIWTAGMSNNKHTIYYSLLLDGTEFTGAGSGTLDISAVVGNNDEIVALADHNGFLVVFCKNNIVVYGNPTTPTDITLSDVITGVGCITRDSVQKTGKDLVFLSRSGVRSLARTIQEKSMPMRELSINIRDELVDNINNEVLTNIKSAYFERDAFYLLSFPATDLIYCFDMRNVLENGGSRVTTWTGLNFKSFCTTEDRNLYLGAEGGIARYFGYTDNLASYRMSYFTSNTDVSSPSILKFLKKCAVTLIGNETQDFVIKYGFDYSSSFTSRTFASNEASVPSEYNIAEYNIGEYTGGILISEIRVNLGGSGRVVKFGVETVINGAPVSIQKAEIFFKLGKLY
jgi:hypothetical protein